MYLCKYWTYKVRMIGLIDDYNEPRDNILLNID